MMITTKLDKLCPDIWWLPPPAGRSSGQRMEQLRHALSSRWLCPIITFTAMPTRVTCSSRRFYQWWVDRLCGALQRRVSSETGNGWSFTHTSVLTDTGSSDRVPEWSVECRVVDSNPLSDVGRGLSHSKLSLILCFSPPPSFFLSFFSPSIHPSF